MVSPHTAWLMLRSLETLKVRMDQQCRNAIEVANFLSQHPLVKDVHYLGLIQPNTPEYEIYRKQYEAPGAMLSFDIVGGEKEAFKFLNALKLIKLAVSLGSTESLAEHPLTMTHVGVNPQRQMELKITPSLIRLSIGVEHHEDIIQDIAQALNQVTKIKGKTELSLEQD